MRQMLRRRIQEDQGYEEQWTDANLNTYLNLGLQFMETEVLKYMPEAYMQIDQCDLYDADNGLAPVPVGCISVKEVWRYDADANGNYKKSEKRSNFWIDTYESDVGLTTDDNVTEVWAPFGRWIRYWPQNGTTTVTNGMRIKYVPVLTMGADSDVPDLHLNLHEGAVYRAQQIALADTDETTSPEVMDSLNKNLAIVVGRIPAYIQPEEGDVGEFTVDIDKEDGWT
jgi:hypothetical protein